MGTEGERGMIEKRELRSNIRGTFRNLYRLLSPEWIKDECGDKRSIVGYENDTQRTRKLHLRTR